jgi:hypothetical protein
MDDGGMTHCDPLPEHTWNLLIAVEDRIVLDVGVGPDLDSIELRPNHHPEQDEHPVPDGHIPV